MKYIPAPPPIGSLPNLYSEVSLWHGEWVEWIWTHHFGGSFVSGYKIHKEEKKPCLSHLEEHGIATRSRM